MISENWMFQLKLQPLQTFFPLFPSLPFPLTELDEVERGRFRRIFLWDFALSTPFSFGILLNLDLLKPDPCFSFSNEGRKFTRKISSLLIFSQTLVYQSSVWRRCLGSERNLLVTFPATIFRSSSLIGLRFSLHFRFLLSAEWPRDPGGGWYLGSSEHHKIWNENGEFFRSSD